VGEATGNKGRSRKHAPNGTCLGFSATSNHPLAIRPPQRLPLSLPELVQAAPSLTADGSVIVGRRESRIYVLDRHTGQPLTTLTSDGAGLGHLAWNGVWIKGVCVLG
jgi:hypothetical protein